MADMRISEAGSAQFPMVRHAGEIGWKALSPQEALEMRGGKAGMLFRGEVGGALRKFNPWMTDDAVRAVLERLEAVPATIEGNREMLDWLRGNRRWHDEAEGRYRRVRLVDFDNPAANALHVTWEWKIEPPARKGNRADVVFAVNGIPVAIVEHKNPADKDAIERGIGQLRRYEKETPELIASAQLYNVTHLLDYWYGVTWNVSRQFMARWKEQPNESYRFAVQSFFEPTEFLRTLREWILFYAEDGETRKTVLRQHQRRAVDRIIDRCAEPSKDRGLIWHTQGSGKTFTLLTAARLILERKERFQTPTVVVVVDRIELEGQLSGWVERLLGEMQQQDIPVWRAKSKNALRDLFRTDKRGLILSMIHKFEGLEKDANTRGNIYVFIDEAHRSVARDLGTYLMAAVPNATIIGFTGTPIARTQYGEGTFKIFGAQDDSGYLDKYPIAESIEDETTLPIRHTMAPSEMTVPAERLDKEFFEMAESEGITDVEELNKVLERAVSLRTFLTADDRIEKVAAFVAKHFQENVAPLGYKAFLVAVNREACAKYKQALDKHLPKKWSAPVYTRNDADIVDRPLVAALQLPEEQEADTRLRFKKAGRNPQILIVTDKLLTGFDAPLLYCMYLDKPMRDHVLLQAIARVNRPYAEAEDHAETEDHRKRIGLVVDFVGVLRELKKALAFDASDVSGVIEDLDMLHRDFRNKLENAKAEYLVVEESLGADQQLEQIIYGRFLGLEPRKAFFEVYKAIEALWEILSPSPDLRDHILAYKQLVRLYASVRNAYAGHVNYEVDLGEKTRRMVQESAAQEGLGDATKTVTFDVDSLKALQQQKGSEEAKVFNLVRGLNREIDSEPELGAVLLPLKERAERIIRDLEERKKTGLEAMDMLAGLAEEKEAAMNAAKQSGLSRRAFGIHWVLKDDHALGTAGVTALELAKEAERLMGRFPNAAVSADEHRRLRAALYRPLLMLDGTERSRIVERILGILLDDGAGEAA
ncbi:MAG: HsdR family type I site-specific deoxyribonuclease [Gammaproteobacteria bacterium]|nr:HsdR family type I site-specific deoxyribonuclease [Gammaproteobacteria bacterium]